MGGRFRVLHLVRPFLAFLPKVDNNVREDRALLNGAQKLLGILIAVGEAVAYVLSGMYGSIGQLGMDTDLLKQKSEMLEEYFSIHIDSNGNLSRLPVILDRYTIDMDRVPKFLLCLGNDVNWDDEKICFQTIVAALGNFYAMHPPLLPNPLGKGLYFYKKRTPSNNGKEGGNSSEVTGTSGYWNDVHLLARSSKYNNLTCLLISL
ncbi:hypothetical protein M9H77_35105 [Catharanthus roseus]|uniref:Uncharacterized protein n=1 Tax=Catharanthus roseus TaxID=4058 RepID=A0ACB9ZNB4_CATRO|nr:hypothetical protein M9H77_35105 [Catharanthus roseus]